MSPRIETRDLDVLSRRRAGETYKQIADRYGLSKERIRQMIVRLERKEKNPPNPRAEDLREIGFSTRTINCLLGHGLTTRAQLQCYSTRDLARIPNMGKVSIEEVSKVVSLAESPVDKLVREQHLVAWLRSLLVRTHKAMQSDDGVDVELFEEISAALLRSDPRNGW
jgi:transcriptional regulator with XRE-family HTH domain